MKVYRMIALAAALLFLPCVPSRAQNGIYDVFVPIAKYLSQGDSDALSAWFADNLEVAVLSRETDASRSQARQILKSFFSSYEPHSFEITHTAGRENMKYALGNLDAGEEKFLVTVFVRSKGDSYKIQQLKIEML